MLHCLCCSMRLLTIFQVVFWTCVWGLPLFVFHVEDSTQTQLINLEFTYPKPRWFPSSVATLYFPKQTRWAWKKTRINQTETQINTQKTKHNDENVHTGKEPQLSALTQLSAILCCSWLHRLELLRQAQVKDSNSGNWLTGNQPAAIEIHN